MMKRRPLWAAAACGVVLEGPKRRRRSEAVSGLRNLRERRNLSRSKGRHVEQTGASASTPPPRPPIQPPVPARIGAEDLARAAPAPDLRQTAKRRRAVADGRTRPASP